MKRILFLGHGSKAGAWKVRGEQLSVALGAQAQNGVHGNFKGWKNIELVVAVKRPLRDDLEKVRAQKLPVVWDIVDAWPQPIGNWWPREACIKWLRDEYRRIQPQAIVATTRAMAEDCAKFGIPVLVLPHHAQPHLKRQEVRPDIKQVGYEGSVNYLGHWASTLRELCGRRGWTFQTHPSAIIGVDVRVAVREQNGYATRNWKSNVKLANAQGSGIPCVLNREQGYLDAACGAELWADTREELEQTFDLLQAENGARVQRADQLFAATPRLNSVAHTYREWLDAL